MKFPRTPHLPGSRGTSDDLRLSGYNYTGPVVLTEKLDGSNIMFNSKKFITRKGGSSSAPWTAPMREIWLEKGWQVPENHWVAGELLYWRKTVPYENLAYPFYMITAVKGNKVLSFEDSKKIAEDLNLPFVKVLATFEKGLPKDFKAEDYLTEGSEGFVVRPLEEFSLPHYGDFVAKFVRPDFLGTATSNGKNTFIKDLAGNYS